MSPVTQQIRGVDCKVDLEEENGDIPDNSVSHNFDDVVLNSMSIFHQFIEFSLLFLIEFSILFLDVYTDRKLKRLLTSYLD